MERAAPLSAEGLRASSLRERILGVVTGKHIPGVALATSKDCDIETRFGVVGLLLAFAPLTYGVHLSSVADVWLLFFSSENLEKEAVNLEGVRALRLNGEPGVVCDIFRHNSVCSGAVPREKQL